jgi:AcrR family transcriptional regulator
MQDGSRDRLSERRQRILEAARHLVLRHGLRGTTMEAIAREAEIAKPTLYAQFPDKDAIYAAIVDGLADDLQLALDRGLNGPGDIAERIGAALAGQYGVLAQVLEGSPHAAELMSEHKRAGAKFREKDAHASQRITAALQEASLEEAEPLTHLLMAAAYGIALKTTDTAAMQAAVMLLCRHMIEGALKAQ